MESQQRNLVPPLQHVSSSVYDDSESDSDIDSTPPTIIKRKSDLPRKPKSKYKGVFRCGKKYKAQIQTTGVQHYLGLFDHEEDAARAYDTHARATCGPKAKTNFVYDPTEPIPHPDTALAPPKSVVIPPLASRPLPLLLEPEKVVQVKGSHPRRTYVGIKARRKRMGGPGDDDENDPANTGADSDTEGGGGTGTGTGTGRRSNSTDIGQGQAIGIGSSSSTQGPPNKVSRFVRALVPNDRNWRDRVCYLAGGLYINNSSDGRQGPSRVNVVHVCLKGKWLTATEDYKRPSHDSITAWTNKNEFYYESLAQESLSSLTLPNNNLRPLSGSYTGFHFRNQGEGGGDVPTKCTETLLQLLFASDSPPQSASSQDSNNNSISSSSSSSNGHNTGCGNYTIVGKGDSDLGKFILFGTYNTQSRKVDIARQFVLDSDPINSFSLQYMLENRTSVGSRLLEVEVAAVQRQTLSHDLAAGAPVAPVGPAAGNSAGPGPGNSAGPGPGSGAGYPGAPLATAGGPADSAGGGSVRGDGDHLHHHGGAGGTGAMLTIDNAPMPGSICSQPGII